MHVCQLNQGCNDIFLFPPLSFVDTDQILFFSKKMITFYLMSIICVIDCAVTASTLCRCK